MKRTIAVVTGSRSEYGLLTPLIRAIQSHAALKLQLMVTGMHLLPQHGNTIEQIMADGFPIAETINLELCDDSVLDIAAAMARGITGFCHAFQLHRPDIVVVLGDRFEILAAAQAAMFCRLTIAHIHGGESSEGVIDEAIRHSISKMAHLHFVSTDIYRRRVIQLGESPERVFNVGALAVDNMRQLELLERDELEESLDVKLGKCNFLVTYHPLTLDPEESRKGIQSLLHALDAFPDCHIIFTRPNADSGGREIDLLLDDYVARNPERCAVYPAMGTLRYMSAIRLVDAVIGNSSSGLIEVPVMRTPSVNIGDRQRGRMRPPSVIDCPDDASSITEAIKQACSREFRQLVQSIASPYGDGTTAEQICDVLQQVDLEHILIKRFYDLDVPI